MLYPEDKDGIRRKLKVIAGYLPKFQAVDCFIGEFQRYFGKHRSEDWQECANEMVSEGKLYSDGLGRYSAKPF